VNLPLPAPRTDTRTHQSETNPINNCLRRVPPRARLLRSALAGRIAEMTGIIAHTAERVTLERLRCRSDVERSCFGKVESSSAVRSRQSLI
jgi:hypothetical protein